MSTLRVLVVVLVVQCGGCAVVSLPRAERFQAQLRCDMSVSEVEAIVGGKLQPIEGRAPRLTHLYRDGMTDLWLIFDDGKLRSSQINEVQGMTGVRPHSVISHCSK